MRLLASTIFFVMFAIWRAADTYVGLELVGSLKRYALYGLVIVVLAPTLFRSIRARRLDWRIFAIAGSSMIGAQIIWGSWIHGQGDFKLYASQIGAIAPLIFAFGAVAAYFEWRTITAPAKSSL